MEYIRSQGSCVFVTVLCVLFCVDFACRVEGDTILRLADIGDNISLSCYRPGVVLQDNYKNWYRNGTSIANWERVFINDPRFTLGVNHDGVLDSNNIYINNVRMNDSATFECYDYHTQIIFHTYDLQVIRCSNCITTNNSNPDKIKVICNLDNYWTDQTVYNEYVTFNGNGYPTVIDKNTFSFSITVTELNRLSAEFYLQIETETWITCMLSTQTTPPSYPTTALLTTSFIQTMQNKPSTLSYKASSISTTKQHTPTNKNASSDKGTSDSNITLFIVILGSAFILILIVIIIVLRCKKTKDRRENKHIGNASIKKERPEVCHESGKDGSGKSPEYATSIKELRETCLDQRSANHPENGEMIDNILYDFTDKTADSSISRVEGPLDDALYAMPDKRATINRESKSTSKVTDRSSTSDHLYGNSAIINQHEQIRGTLQQGDQHEDVKMPGSGGDAEEIPLYDMPDKGPTRNTLKATPEAGQTPTLSKDEVVSVDALYAEVDKTKKKYTNN